MLTLLCRHSLVYPRFSYNYVLTARILLSWFPQAQSFEFLAPLYTVTDPFLNTFRGLVPSIGGIDLSPLLGFFLLNALTQATGAVGADGKDLDKEGWKRAKEVQKRMMKQQRGKAAVKQA